MKQLNKWKSFNESNTEKMVSKLIKLNGDFYIVNDSKISHSDKYFDFTHNIVLSGNFAIESDFNIKKITHSTKELNGVKKINLFDIEEIIYKSKEKFFQWDIVIINGKIKLN